MQKKNISLAIFILSCILIVTSCATLKTSDAKFILKHNERVVAASFYRAENKLATITTDGIITLWDINNGGMVGRIETNNDNSITSLVYTEDGIIIIYDNGNIVMYDPLNIKEPKTRSVPEGSIEKFVYSHEGKRMIFGILDKTAIRSGGGTSVVIKAPGTTEYLRDDRIKETEIFNRRLVSVGFYANKNFKDIVLPNNAVRSVDSDSMSSYRRTGDDLMDNMNEMNERSYRMRVEQLERSFELTSIAISPDEIIACGLYNGEIIIYDGKTNRELHRFQNSDDNAVLSLAFSPNGRYLLSGSLDRIIRLWDRENNWSMVTQRSLVQTDSLFFSPNNDSFIAKRDYSFFVVNARNGSVLRTIEDSRVKSIFYTENNEIIIIGIENQSVLVW